MQITSVKKTAAPDIGGAAWLSRRSSGAAAGLFPFRCSFTVFATHPRRKGILQAAPGGAVI